MATNWLCGILSSNAGSAARGVLLGSLLAAVALAPVHAQVTVPSAASAAPAAAQPVAPVQPVLAAPGDTSAVPASTWKLLRLIKLPNPGAASLDRRGSLYVADADNNLRQYGPEGIALNTYAPTQPGHAALVKPGT